MIRLLALFSYVYQSLTAIALIFAVSHIVEAPSYTAFSLILASSQFLSVLAFEWLQLAGVRFLAGAPADDVRRLKSSLFSAFALSAAALVGGGLVVLGLGAATLHLAALGLAVAVLQGLTELQFTMIRVSGRLGASSALMVLRATTLLAGAVAGAWLFRSAEATLAGMLAGHAVGLAAGTVVDRGLLDWSIARTSRADLTGFCAYGMPAAGASVIHLSVPVLIRFLVVGRLGTASDAAAGFSMAFDLLQRPFTVLVSAIHIVSYPDVVSKYDRGTPQEARDAAARLFEFILCTTAVMMGGVVAFLPDAAWLFVPRDLLAGFLSVGPAAALFYFLHTHLQATAAVVPHLRKTAVWLVVVAGAQLAACAVLVWLALSVGLTIEASLFAAGLATLAIIVAASGPTRRFGAVPKPALVAAAILGGFVIGALVLLPSQPIAWLAGKVIVAAAVTFAIVWIGDFLQIGRHRRA